VARAPCPIPVEVVGAGVGCVPLELAARARVRAGDRLALDGGRVCRSRMAPARLAAWDAPVDVNHATVDELASLDGIGPKLAERIVARRPFTSLEALGRVSGIGEKRLARLRPRLLLPLDE
jgi:competence ComEA-like helix-hairpin-helix protein